MSEQEFISYVKRRLAQIAVGASALRNQGGSRIVLAARSYFEKSVDLDEFFKVLPDEQEYQNFLDRHTTQLAEIFSAIDNWGAARKGLNLFFRELVYNKFIADFYSLPNNFKEFNQMIRHLEVPLDQDVAYGIYTDSDIKPPKWDRIRRLKKAASDQYQSRANEIAAKKDIARVHLDLEYWRKEKQETIKRKKEPVE